MGDPCGSFVAVQHMRAFGQGGLLAATLLVDRAEALARLWAAASA